jgi:hypothetical protein
VKQQKTALMLCAGVLVWGGLGIAAESTLEQTPQQAQQQVSQQQNRSRNRSQDAEVNLGSTIIGNREQPKVLYIVPWKAVDAAEVDSHIIQSQLDDVFGHVEPIELRRQLHYMKTPQ